MWHNALHKETAPGSGEKMARFRDQDKEKVTGTFNLNSIMNHIIRPDV